MGYIDTFFVRHVYFFEPEPKKKKKTGTLASLDEGKR